MRRILSLLMILLPFLAMAEKQQFQSAIVKPNDKSQLAYEKVVPVNHTNKAELYKKMRFWITANTSSSDFNTMFDDINHDIIIVSPTLSLEDFKNKTIQTQKVTFKLVLSFKDNKMRIQANAFNYFGIVSNNPAPVAKPLQDIDFSVGYLTPVKRIGELFDESFTNFVNALENAANAPGDGNENW